VLFPSSELPEFHPVAWTGFNTMKQLTSLCLRHLSKHIGLPEEYVNTIIEGDLSQNEKHSQCVLEIFNYHRSVSEDTKTIPCKDHSDIGMVTAIPLSVNKSKGLQLFSWIEGKWIDIEDNVPENYCVIFGGETLARVTNNFIFPAVHQVAAITQPRRSFPFLLLAKQDSILDSNKLNKEVVGPIVFPRAIEASLFVSETSAKRVSSLFRYNNISEQFI